jgi:hypothetical protein
MRRHWRKHYAAALLKWLRERMIDPAKVAQTKMALDPSGSARPKRRHQWAVGFAPPNLTVRSVSASGTAASAISISTQNARARADVAARAKRAQLGAARRGGFGGALSWGEPRFRSLCSTVIGRSGFLRHAEIPRDWGTANAAGGAVAYSPCLQDAKAPLDGLSYVHVTAMLG